MKNLIKKYLYSLIAVIIFITPALICSTIFALILRLSIVLGLLFFLLIIPICCNITYKITDTKLFRDLFDKIGL